MLWQIVIPMVILNMSVWLFFIYKNYKITKCNDTPYSLFAAMATFFSFIFFVINIFKSDNIYSYLYVGVATISIVLLLIPFVLELVLDKDAIKKIYTKPQIKKKNLGKILSLTKKPNSKDN